MTDLGSDRLTIKWVWNQKHVPVVMRRSGRGERLRARLPFDLNNRAWLQQLGRSRPEWIVDGKYWEIPKAWFNDYVNRCLQRYGHVYIIQPFREQEKCAPACRNAAGHECECSCMGRNHGVGDDGSWFDVSDTFSFRQGPKRLACRLLTAKNFRTAHPTD